MRKETIACILAVSNIRNDPRVTKEAQTLSRFGYQTIVVGVFESGLPARETADDYSIIRVKYFLYGAVVVFKKISKFFQRHEGPVSTKDRKISFFAWIAIALHLFLVNLSFVLIISRLNPSICHCSDLNTLPAGYMLHKRTKCQLIYDAHELWEDQLPNTPLWWKKICLWIENHVMRHVSALIAVNDFIGETIQKRNNFSSYSTILNCPPYRETKDNRSEFIALSMEKVFVLYQGRYDSARGLEELIQSAKFFADNVVLIMRGYGDTEPQLKVLVREMKLNEKVFFVPPVPMDKLVESAQGADIGVIPYLPQCLNNIHCTPNKLFEYMHAGLALLGSDLPELSDIIVKNNIGEVFIPGDMHSIAEHVNQMVADRDRLDRMKYKSFCIAKDKYNWQVEEGKLLSIYQNLK